MVVVISGIQWEAELVGVHYRRIETWLVFLQFGYDIHRRSKMCRNMDRWTGTQLGTPQLSVLYWESHQNLSPTQPSQPSQKTQQPKLSQPTEPSQPFPPESKPASFPTSPSNTSRTTFKPKVCASCTSSLNNSWRIRSCLRAHWIGFKGRIVREQYVYHVSRGIYRKSVAWPSPSDL